MKVCLHEVAIDFPSGLNSLAMLVYGGAVDILSITAIPLSAVYSLA